MFLNPDEVYNYLAINEPSLGAAFRSAMSDNPHPPLYYILLFLWHQLGDSDLWLRLLSVLAGTAGLWVAYQWLARAVNKTTAIAGVFLLTFATQHVNLSAELRAYTVLLLLLVTALCFLERALQERSAIMMALYSLALALAILDDYSAAWVALAAGIYVLTHMVGRRIPARVAAAWIGGQAVCAGIAFFLYRASVASLRGSSFETWVREVMLKESYRQTAEKPLAFLAKATISFFHYLLSTRAAGWVGVALFVAGVLLLALRRVDGRRLWAFALLMLLPFVFVGGAAAARLYPYGGTRHSFFLMVFAVVGIGSALSQFARQRLRTLLPMLLFLLPLWKWIGRPEHAWFGSRHNLRREYLLAGVERLRSVTGPGGVVFSDQQAHLLLRRYYCTGSHGLPKGGADGFTEYHCDGLTLVGMGAWGPSADSFSKEFRRMERVYGLRRGDTVWGFSGGWGWNMATQIQRDRGVPLSGASILRDNVAVFPLVVGHTLSELPDDTTDWAVIEAVEILAGFARARWAGSFRFALWPGHYLPDATSPVYQNFPAVGLTYAELYQLLATGRQDITQFLPALALWVFNDAERQLSYMRLMDGGHSYAVGGLRFTLLALARDAIAGAYLIEVED
jgi:hypothetical protein